MEGGGDFFVDAWSIGDATAWCCRRMLEQETLWGTIEEKPVMLSFSLSFPYCSLFSHNFLRCDFFSASRDARVLVVLRACDN